jgi:CBS domain-containing protein
MNVRDVMQTAVVTIEDTATYHQAIEKMARYRIRHLPVVTRAGMLCGVVTDRDLRHYLFDPASLRQFPTVRVEMLLKSTRVSRLMTAAVTTVDADERLEDAARVMHKGKFGCLPVLDNGRLVGIVTETDLLRRIVGEACCADVATMIVSSP